MANPAFGAVTLCSEVADSAGDHSMETIYRAYAIGRAPHAAAVVTGARSR